MLDSYTKLLLQGNRTVGPSSAIIDEMGHAITKNGDVQISTSTKKFGAGSIAFDGTGDYLTSPDSTDWFFSTGDFTIDLWVNFNSLPTSGNGKSIIAQTDLSANAWGIQIKNVSGSYKWNFYIYETGYTVNVDFLDHASPATLTTGVWYHFAITKNNNNYRIFRDGTQCGSTLSDSNDIPNVSGLLYIGTNGTSDYLNGYVDELRISKGIARWTSNFTPSAVEYYTDSLNNIIWTDLVNVTATGNDLEKTSGSDSAWDAGAFSTLGFEEDGQFEFTINDITKDKIFGLSIDNSSVGYNTIDFGIYATSGFYVMQSGSQLGPYGSALVSGDVLSIQRVGTTIYYKRNGVTVYTSLISSSGKLYADTSIYKLNAKLINGQISSPLIFDKISLSDSWTEVKEFQPLPSGYAYKRLITIDHTKFSSTQTNFPILVKLDENNFDFTKLLTSGGGDVKFTANDESTILQHYNEFCGEITYPLEDFCNDGVADASAYSSASFLNAFDNNTSTYWHGFYWGVPYWLSYDLGSGVTKIGVKYRITPYLAASNAPKDFKLQGSNNNSTWTDLDTQTNQTWTDSTLKEYTFSNTTAYRYYRLYITAVTGGNNEVDIKELEILEASAPASKKFGYFWIKVPSVSSTVDTEIYMFYGKSGDADVSSGADTFLDVSKYMCDENTNSTTVSDVMQVNNAVASSNTDVLHTYNGKIYNGFNIARVNSVNIGNVLNIDGTDYTISLWFRSPYAYLLGETFLISKRASASSTEDGYSIALLNDTTVCVHYYTDTNHTIPNVADNVWHKLDVVFDYTNHRTYVYLDGTISSSSPLSHTQDNQSNTENLYIGKCKTGKNFQGRIDLVSFYQGIKSVNYISSSYQNEGGTILTIGAEEDNVLSTAINESLNLSDSWDLQLNPISQAVSDILSLTDSWEFQVNPDNQSISDSLLLSDSWELSTNPEQQTISDIISLSDSWELLINLEPENIFDTLSLSDGWDLQLSQINQDISDSLSISDSWLIDRKGRFDTKFLTKLYMILPVAKKYATDLRTIYGTSIKYATKLYLQYTNILSYKTDLRVTTPTPISIGTLEDFVVKLDGITLTDVDYNTLLINLSLNTTPSTATFTLARRHDDLNYKLDGTLSTITAENKVEVFDGTRKLFTGYISEINADSQNDTVHVTASDCRLKMSRVSYRIEYGGAWRMDADHNGIADDDITENTNNIPWNAPDYIKFEKNIGQAFTEVIAQASSIISGYDNLPFSGTYVPEFVTSENNLTSLIDELIRQTANCNWYIDENERLKFQTVGTGEIKTLNLASLNSRRSPYDLIIDDVRLNIKNSSYAQKITVKLGKNINQVWRRQTFSGNLNEDYQTFLTNLKDKTTFVFHQTGEHVYPRLDRDGTGNGGYPGGAFYTGMNGTTIYYFSYGVYLSYPTVVVQWLDIHSPLNTHLNLPDITIGSGTPTKTLYLTSYGVKTGNTKWGEEVKIGQNPNGSIGSNNPEGDYTYLAYFQDEQYDRRAFAEDLANFELSQNNKLETSASLLMLLDAYEYYNLSFSNLINLSNTLRAGIYNNNNGFPLNVDNIKIDCSKRTVNLGLTNYGKSYYVKTSNIMTNYTPPSTTYVARKVVWQIIDANGTLHSTG